MKTDDLNLGASNLAYDFDPAPIVETKKFVEPHWWNDDFSDSYTDKVRKIVKSFIEGNLDRAKYQAMNARHVFSTKNNGTELWMLKDNPSLKVRVCVARVVNGGFVGNSSGLMAMRQALSKNRKRAKINWGGGRLKIQEVLQDCMPMVPFRLFTETRLDLNLLSIIDKAPDEMIDVGRKEKGKPVLTHFTGAMLFKIGVRSRSRGVTGETERFFLFDIDRNDLALKNFNVFLSRLGRPATSIEDAYDSLKPDEVRNAERFLKRPCDRQGEWFFIPVQGDFKTKKLPSYSNGLGRPAKVRAELRSKGNRPHFVEELSEEGYVRGKVTHGGFEHKPIELETWHKPVPNTAVESFKISGAVD